MYDGNIVPEAEVYFPPDLTFPFANAKEKAMKDMSEVGPPDVVDDAPDDA